MKIQVTLKDPDTMHDAVADAVAKDVKTSVVGVSKAERDVIAAERVSEIAEAITYKWMAYGEYLTVEFDTEAGTATVIPDKR